MEKVEWQWSIRSESDEMVDTEVQDNLDQLKKAINEIIEMINEGESKNKMSEEENAIIIFYQDEEKHSEIKRGVYFIHKGKEVSFRDLTEFDIKLIRAEKRRELEEGGEKEKRKK